MNTLVIIFPRLGLKSADPKVRPYAQRFFKIATTRRSGHSLRRTDGRLGIFGPISAYPKCRFAKDEGRLGENSANA